MRPPPHVYSVRLGQLMNTYWTCTTDTYALSGGLTNETSFLDTSPSFELVDSYATAIGQESSILTRRGRQARLWRTKG
jgi:hypothetical protein